MSLVLAQFCSDVVANWVAPTSPTCPITRYIVSISGFVMSVDANQTSYTIPMNDSVCGKTFEVSVSAIIAAGTSNTTSKDITIICTGEEPEPAACACKY